jgi:hypothetical protein
MPTPSRSNSYPVRYRQYTLRTKNFLKAMAWAGKSYPTSSAINEYDNEQEVSSKWMGVVREKMIPAGC